MADHANDLIPSLSSIAAIYSDAPSPTLSSTQSTRWQNLLSTFSSNFSHSPAFVARSPGRVNIIGEHIDYSLYDVLPMAVEVDVLVAARAIPLAEARQAGEGGSHRKANFKIVNADSGGRFVDCEFDVSVSHTNAGGDEGEDAKAGAMEFDLEIDATRHEWTNYFKAGLKGAVGLLLERGKRGQWAGPVDMEVVVDGNVPPGGGLSSSAALVCASALSVMVANNHDVTKQDLFELAAVSERAVGVYSGGMDQAASIFSQEGRLLDCSFFPSFSAVHVPLPHFEPEVTFLVAQSFVAADKHTTAPKHYNLRVVECTLAAVVLAHLHNATLKPDSSPLGFSLRNVQEELTHGKGLLAGQTPKQQLLTMTSIVEDRLDKKGGYTRADLADMLDLSVEQLEAKFLSTFPVDAEKFQLRKRALHVLSEAKRVLEFKEILSSQAKRHHPSAGGRSGDSIAQDQEEALRSLGSLMNATQQSCAEVYNCSTPELDEICAIASRAGTYGSRLTGAGWGGCTVHLLPQNRVEAVTQALEEEYYCKRFSGITAQRLREALVISRPSRGAAIVTRAAMEAVRAEGD